MHELATAPTPLQPPCLLKEAWENPVAFDDDGNDKTPTKKRKAVESPNKPKKKVRFQSEVAVKSDCSMSNYDNDDTLPLAGGDDETSRKAIDVDREELSLDQLNTHWENGTGPWDVESADDVEPESRKAIEKPESTMSNLEDRKSYLDADTLSPPHGDDGYFDVECDICSSIFADIS